MKLLNNNERGFKKVLFKIRLPIKTLSKTLQISVFLRSTARSQPDINTLERISQVFTRSLEKKKKHLQE